MWKPQIVIIRQYCEDVLASKYIFFDLCQIHLFLVYNYQMDNRVNYVEFIKTIINAFLGIAIVISLFQEFNFSSPDASATPDQATQPIPQIPANGTKVEGLIIYTSDSFRKPFKDLLIQKQYNIEIKEFQFVGQEYWVNLFLTHGHILVVFFLVSRYQSEQEQGAKTKLMIFGMVVVIGWMFLTPQLKTQRLALDYKGQRVYEKDVFIPNDIEKQLAEYNELDTFGLQPEAQAIPNQKVISNEADQVIPQGQIYVDF